MELRIIIAAGAAVLLAAGVAHAGNNLLINGSFETNNGESAFGFPGWTVASSNLNYACEGDTVSCGDYTVASGAEDGTWYMSDGTFRRNNTIRQTFADTIGVVYSVSGWVASDGPTYGGQTEPALFSLAVGATVFGAEDPAVEQGWTQYTGSFTGTGSDTLTITTRNGENYNYFDNFSVSSVPEPAVWTMMIGGLALAGARLRRHRAVGLA